MIATVTRHPPGSAHQAPMPGDFILTHAHAWTSRMIRFGEGLRWRGPRAGYAYWSHAALVVSKHGHLVEALGAGVQRSLLSKYAGADYAYVHVDMPPLDRQEAVQFAVACVGREYGYATVVALGLSCLSGGKWAFSLSGTEICSALVASALERGPYVFPGDPASMMPADLAQQFGVGPA